VAEDADDGPLGLGARENDDGVRDFGEKRHCNSRGTAMPPAAGPTSTMSPKEVLPAEQRHPQGRSQS
jgi:hypothetical protein